MRITGGKYRSKNVKCPPGIIRPSMDRMRESMFSILGDIRGLRFLDVFSGSTIIALEAASRSCTDIEIVELDTGKKQVIMENLALVKEKIRVNFIDALSFLNSTKRNYDIIHLDPPFPMENKIQFLEAIEKNKLLNPKGIVMMHYPKGENYPVVIGELKQTDHRSYGKSQLIFYTRE